MITVQVNGQPQEMQAGASVEHLVLEMGMDPRTLLIEHDGAALLRQEWKTTELVDGACLEIFRVAAGG